MRGRTLLLLCVGGFVGLTVLANLPDSTSPPDTSTATTPTPAPTPAVQPAVQAIPAPTPAPKPTIQVPEVENMFIGIIAQEAQRYNSAANEMLQGAARNNRKKLLCTAFPDPTITGWIGTISRLTSTEKGDGVLSIKIHNNPDIWIMTNNNNFSDSLSDTPTLINPESDLFKTVSQMQQGDEVRFSGQFVSSDTAAFRS